MEEESQSTNTQVTENKESANTTKIITQNSTPSQISSSTYTTALSYSNPLKRTRTSTNSIYSFANRTPINLAPPAPTKMQSLVEFYNKPGWE
jgi:hypothetical protein